MPIYKNKPKKVEANQWLGPTNHHFPGVYYTVKNGFHVITAQGTAVPIKNGEYIILEAVQNIQGTILAYPCDPKIFEENYELA